MKKQTFIFLLTLSSTIMGLGLHATEFFAENFYVGAFGGVNFLQRCYHTDSKVGFATGISGGYKFQNNIRVEAELAYRRNNLKKSSDYNHFDLRVESYSVMGNAYYDFDIGCRWSPYVGVGIGFAENKVVASHHNHEFSVKENGFAYQGIAGVNYKICDKTDVGLEYRYFESRKHFKDHTLAIAVKRYF